MELNAREICRGYESADSKKAKIKILADLNECGQTDILRILIENGIDVSEAGQLKADLKKDSVANLIMKMLDETAEEVSAAEQKYKVILNVMHQYGKSKEEA